MGLGIRCSAVLFSVVRVIPHKVPWFCAILGLFFSSICQGRNWENWLVGPSFCSRRFEFHRHWPPFAENTIGEGWGVSFWLFRCEEAQEILGRKIRRVCHGRNAQRSELAVELLHTAEPSLRSRVSSRQC